MIPALALLAAAAPPSQPTSTWSTAPETPLQLAHQVDVTMQGLSNTVLEYSFSFQTSIGKGFQLEQCAFGGPKKFRLEYPVIGHVEREGIKRITLVANWPKMARRKEDQKTRNMPYTTKRDLPSDLVGDWFKHCAGDMFSSVGTKLTPLTMLVAQASRPNSGYIVKAERRRVVYQGKPIDNERITIERTPAQSKTKGKLFYEIVIDEQHHLPTMLSNTMVIGDKTYTVDLRDSHWRHLTIGLAASLFDTRRVF